MPIAVELPKLGNTVEECVIAKWRKQKGETVSAGDVIAEIETDKTTFELPAPASGTLLETFFPEGALVPVFTNICAIGAPGESTEDLRPAPNEEASEASLQDPDGTPTTPPGAFQDQSASGAGSSAFSPRARRFSGEHDFHPTGVIGSGPGGRVLEQDLRELYYSSPQASRSDSEHGGSGEEAPARESGAQAASLSGIRAKIARRMRESLSVTAQYTLNGSAEAGGLLALRARIKASADAPDININDLITFCTIKALIEMPDLNARFLEGKLYRSLEIHMGFACDTPRGLMVPVIRNAQALSLGDLAVQTKKLTAQAVQANIAVDDLSGATFTISNLGGLGIETFTPLLNPPQVAVLGVGAIQLKAVRRQGGIEFVDSIGLSLTCDHQIIDGAPGARFLQVLKEKIENVESLCKV